MFARVDIKSEGRCAPAVARGGIKHLRKVLDYNTVIRQPLLDQLSVAR